MNAIWPYLSELCRLFLLIALLVAAWSKSVGFAAFRKSLGESFSWSPNVIAAATVTIVAAEWLGAALLVFPATAYGVGGLAALALFAAFTTIIAWSLIANRRIVCSCFGESSAHRVSRYDLARNLIFVAAAGLLAARAGTADVVATTVGFVDTLMLAGLGAIAFLASTAVRDIVTLLQLPVED